MGRDKGPEFRVSEKVARTNSFVRAHWRFLATRQEEHMSLEFKTTQKALNAYVISCAGRLDTETAPLLEKEVRRLIGLGPQVLALDLEQLTYMSSAGVRVLMIVHKGMKDLDGKVALLRLQPQ